VSCSGRRSRKQTDSIPSAQLRCCTRRLSSAVGSDAGRGISHWLEALLSRISGNYIVAEGAARCRVCCRRGRCSDGPFVAPLNVLKWVWDREIRREDLWSNEFWLAARSKNGGELQRWTEYACYVHNLLLSTKLSAYSFVIKAELLLFIQT
jgi:hypothetical protein